MAEFITKCPHCNNDLQVQDEWLGMELECPMCKNKFCLSSPTAVQPPPAPKTLNRKKIVILLAISVVVILAVTVLLFSCDGKSTTATSNSVVSVAASPHKKQLLKIPGIDFEYLWKYTADDFNQDDFTLFIKYSDGNVKAVTKQGLEIYPFFSSPQYGKNLFQIITSDSNAIDRFTKNCPEIFDRIYEQTDNVIGYMLDDTLPCGDIFLIIHKYKADKKVLWIKENIDYRTFWNIVANSDDYKDRGDSSTVIPVKIDMTDPASAQATYKHAIDLLSDRELVEFSLTWKFEIRTNKIINRPSPFKTAIDLWHNRTLQERIAFVKEKYPDEFAKRYAGMKAAGSITAEKIKKARKDAKNFICNKIIKENISPNDKNAWDNSGRIYFR